MIKEAALAVMCLTSQVAAASPLEGYWTNPSRSVTVRVAPCGGEALCGRVIRASSYAKAKAAAAGTPQLVGVDLMSDLKLAGNRSWRGTFFVPDRNLRAPGTLHLLSSHTLEIEGCAMAGLLCKSQQWSRVAAPAKARSHR